MPAVALFQEMFELSKTCMALYTCVSVISFILTRA